VVVEYSGKPKSAAFSNFHTPAFVRYPEGMHWRKITLIGVGLLGGSLGLAIKQRRLADKVDGYVRRTTSIAECEKLGVVDRATDDLTSAVENADLVVLCTPLSQMRELTEEMLPALKPGAVVTDVGSVKAGVVEELEPRVAGAGAQFVGSHPMAGGEKTGVAAARPDLFANALCLVTPTADSHKDAVRQVEQFWQALGMRLLKLSPSAHDDLVSRSSHLPHVVAAELANYILSPAHPPEQSAVCANGFRDTTRIASGSPEMWRDIAMANRKNLSRVLGVFLEDLEEFRLALEKGDVGVVEEFFGKAKQRRDHWVGSGNSSE
jgi:prephenate dehydrogenase